MWDALVEGEIHEAEQREQELQDTTWSNLLNSGYQVARYDGDTGDPWSIIDRILISAHQKASTLLQEDVAATEEHKPPSKGRPRECETRKPS